VDSTEGVSVPIVWRVMCCRYPLSHAVRPDPRDGYTHAVNDRVNDHLLGIYLDDHRGGAAGGVEVARRARANNAGTEFEPFLAWLHEQISADRDALDRIAQQIGHRPASWKRAAGWVAAKLGNVKLNGRWLSYSPLSRVLELEMLMAGVQAKQQLWYALRLLDIDRVDHDELTALIRRAGDQLDRLAEHHRMAVSVAFADE
jgi:hypothetical protein